MMVLLLLLGTDVCGGADAHDRRFWLDLKQHDFAVPTGESVDRLASEAAQLLGSTDPELRDDVAYNAIATWVYRRELLDATELISLEKQLMSGAQQRLGDSQGDGLFLRSFSTLALSIVATEDLKKPFLTATQYSALVDLGCRQLERERDLRGYVRGKGWGHATAHAADLLKFLARSPRLSVQQQTQIVDCVAARLRTAGQVFVWGEDARLAAALAALVQRDDADIRPFEVWFQRLALEYQCLWQGAFDTRRFVTARTQLNALSELQSELDTEASSRKPMPVSIALRKLREATR